jgi:hypothetical protein
MESRTYPQGRTVNRRRAKQPLAFAGEDRGNPVGTMTMGEEPKFSAAETTWLLERGFEIDENEGTARVSGEMTLDLVKGIEDTAMIYVLLPDDTVVCGRVLDLSHIIARADYLRK